MSGRLGRNLSLKELTEITLALAEKSKTLNGHENATTVGLYVLHQEMESTYYEAKEAVENGQVTFTPDEAVSKEDTKWC